MAQADRPCQLPTASRLATNKWCSDCPNLVAGRHKFVKPASLGSNTDFLSPTSKTGAGTSSTQYIPMYGGRHQMLVLAGADISSASSMTTRGIRGSTSLRGRAKSLTVSGTSRGLWKPKRDERSSACGRMAEKSTFPVNSKVIYNRWESGANSIVDTRQSKTVWPKGKINQLWKRRGQCWRRRSTGPRR